MAHTAAGTEHGHIDDVKSDGEEDSGRLLTEVREQDGTGAEKMLARQLGRSA